MSDFFEMVEFHQVSMGQRSRVIHLNDTATDGADVTVPGSEQLLVGEPAFTATACVSIKIIKFALQYPINKNKFHLRISNCKR